MNKGFVFLCMTALTCVVAALATWVYLHLGDRTGFIPVVLMVLWLVSTASDEFDRDGEQ